jgi:YD repeat-containing protein
MRNWAAVPLAALALAAASPARAAEGESVERRALSGGGTRELVYRSGALAEERTTDSLGALLEETIYAAPASTEGAAKAAETRKYLRAKSGRLERVEARNAKGELIGSLDYRYDRTGRLLGVSSSGSYGPGGAGMISVGGSPQGAWISAGLSSTVSSYDEKGRPLVLKTMKDGAAILLEKRTYGDGAGPVRVEAEDLASGAASTTDFDGSGRPVLRKDSIKGREASRTTYLYDDAGRLAEETTRDSSGAVTARALAYGADGGLSREETRKDGTLMSAVQYVEGGRIEELYRGGELFVKATYEAGRKVKDEFYSGGKPLREKEYK